jgi:hypothetical protein
MENLALLVMVFLSKNGQLNVADLIVDATIGAEIVDNLPDCPICSLLYLHHHSPPHLNAHRVTILSEDSILKPLS